MCSIVFLVVGSLSFPCKVVEYIRFLVLYTSLNVITICIYYEHKYYNVDKSVIYNSNDNFIMKIQEKSQYSIEPN